MLLRSKLLTKASRYKEAARLLKTLDVDSDTSRTNQSECHIVLGVAQLRAGEVREAVRVLGDMAEERVPRMLREIVYYNRGVAKLRLGLCREGLADMSRALVVKPESYRVRHCTIIIYYNLNVFY